MGFFNNLPMFVDETQHARHTPRKITDLSYTTSSGQERARGTAAGGLQEASTFRLVIISTGETSISDFITEPGGQARILCMTCPPFGENEHSREHADLTKREVLKHHGHFGPIIIEWMLNNRDKWDALEKFWHEEKTRMIERYGHLCRDNTILARRFGHVALLTTAAIVLHHNLDLPRPTGYQHIEGDVANNPVINMLIRQLTGSVDSHSPVRRQFEKFRNLIITRKHDFLFFADTDCESTSPRNGRGWLGLWQDNPKSIKPGSIPNEYIYVFEHEAHRLITEATGIANPQSAIDSWCAQKLIWHEASSGQYERGSARIQIDLAGVSYSCIRIERKTIYNPIA